MSDIESIRAKRLAKLQSACSKREASTEAIHPENSAKVDPKRKELKGKSSLVSLLPKVKKDMDKMDIDSASASISRISSPKPKQPFNLKLWKHKVVCRTLSVTLDENEKDKQYLPSLKAELEESGHELLFDEDQADSAIVSQLNCGKKDVLGYLVDSWKKLDAIASRFSKDENYQSKMDFINNLKRLCVSYAGISIYLPDTFNLPPIDFVKELLKGTAVPFEFVAELVQRFENDGLVEIFAPVLESLSLMIGRMNVENVEPRYMHLLAQLCSLKPIAAIVTTLPSWPCSDKASQVEYNTFLGRLASLSVFTNEVAAKYFSNGNERSYREISSSISSLQLIMTNHQEQLFQIVNSLIRVSAGSREAVLDFFAKVANINHKRQSLQADFLSISSDALMINLTSILNRLSEPFLDLNFTKIDRVEIEYLRRSPRIDIREETKLDADQKASDEFYSKKDSGKSNFISEIFFLNLAFHYYGINGSYKAFEQLLNGIRDMENYRDRLIADSQGLASGPQAAQVHMQIDRINKKLDLDRSFVYCYEVMLSHTACASRSFNFLNFVIVWLLRLVDKQHSYPKTPLTLPLARDVSPEVLVLPEYFVETIADFLLSLLKSGSSSLELHTYDNLVDFCIAFLPEPLYIKNPYLRSKLAEILYFGVMNNRGRGGILNDALNTSKLATQHLMRVLMSFYIEIESTGQSTQFYDKFNIRYFICEIFRSIWTRPSFMGKLEKEQQQDEDFFVRFVALMLNDATYLLDEALIKLSEIHNLQEEFLREVKAEGVSNETMERQQRLSSAERQATSYCQLANETMSMLRLFTSSIPKAFCAVEIVDRLAAMLDYNVSALCGPKCRGLKVKDPSKYNFDAKRLLSGIFDIYLNLIPYERFIEAVAHDGRSYNKELFDRAITVLTKYNIKSSLDIQTLRGFVVSVEKVRAEEAAEEEDLGEVPDEFLDPLMFTLMKDPVILPRSGVSIDRDTIKSHLLSDPTDPFNRMPLKLEDVQPNDELRERIQAFLSSKRKRKVTSE
ncbi:ubiquitin-protein ligase E4 [Schizosaccharomyces japonicus yFS275]|uniref:RING-type E3 ubiquitin transferase n=1 Tax=Schizosaccharomyces japonicus (strain yFS275 / FY16936) TaxID=402676 RepID=B6K0W7_SCHJY|nr:ubiquitin-protein ligase E4 [Schizosaccharomyces japonicus yFS275]EEB07588.1 ubiquitin-protein ligase E4 [Schizosaccharomyces japonicus yFS275]